MEKPSGKHGLLKNPTIYTSISFPQIGDFPPKKARTWQTCARCCHSVDGITLRVSNELPQPQKWDTSKSSAWRTSAISLGTGRHLQPAGLHFVTRQMQIQNHGFVSNIWANYIDSLLRKRWKETCSGSISFNVETQCHKATIWGWLLYHPFVVYKSSRMVYGIGFTT